MNPEIQRHFGKLEKQKQSILSGVAGLSAAQLKFRPEPSAWCVLDVLDHLVKVEEALLQSVRIEMEAGKAISASERMMAMVVIGVMRSPIRVKVPASATMVLPAPTDGPDDSAMRWDLVREDMAGLLRSLAPEQLRRGVFRHPVSGWMTMSTALGFLSAHLRHHEYQLDRLKRGPEGSLP